MKRRILGLVAAVTIGATALGGAPASASTVKPAVDPGTVVTIIKGAYDIYKSFTSGGTSIQAATAQILAAINSAKTDIINHIDAIATAEAKACAQDAVVDFPNFEFLSPDNKQVFALNTTHCVNLIDSLLTAVSSKASIDQLGFALNSIGPIALITRSRSGIPNTSLTPVLVHSNRQVQSLLAPTCRPVTIERRTEWVCNAYNGDQFGPDVPVGVVQAKAGARTSWAVAQAVLPTLTTL
ncbi:hypothetical protein [Actinocrispum wychmicini]|uniref:Uncharacterized protein n=1 Tax=Actinocrispum wychmicini TaxID=1213861 RepID=A0A4V2S7E0_9PSEU|nr:hypothetical protein [Actinocrispum wychmicini]TCO59560.1 hypothetical protein EV192_104403 [Actinocrispum wychmicini]